MLSEGNTGLIRDWDSLIEFREFVMEDLKEVYEIELKSFKSPWSKEMFIRELELEFAYNRVAELKRDEMIAGYIFCWVVLNEATILSLAVRSDLRGEGLGGYILKRALLDFKGLGVREVWLEVRPSNIIARGLYRKFGFQEIGIRPRYYQDSNEDAIVMKKEL